jgi:hypothetical protein
MKQLYLGLVVALLTISTFQISIPLTQNVNRCMIVYTSTPDENLILDMKFPVIPNKEDYEHFKVAIINTEDKSMTEEIVQSGTYRK